MKLLVFTQVMDTEDPVLGFFCGWVEALAARTEQVTVVCLREGTHALPPNVRVYSLGKEQGVGKLTYLFRFYHYVWRFRHDYDAVFVHMNQEYVLLGGVLWKLWGKRIYLWRNHYAGSLLTSLAAAFCTKVFCTSKHSYTARFKNTVLMPVGINFEPFAEAASLEKAEPNAHSPRSILFLARIAPSKRPEMLIDALGAVLARGVSFTATIVGSPLPHDATYARSLEARAAALGLHDRVRFLPGVPHADTPRIFAAHDIFVNCSPSGMFDKTLFEAAAAGCRVIAASDDFHDAAGDEAYAPNTEALTERLIEALQETDHGALRRRYAFQALGRAESLGTLMDRLDLELQP